MRSVFYHYMIMFACVLFACGRSDPFGPAETEEFSDPQPVTILGYDDDAMEPFISRDGLYLFFNNSNDASVNTNLYWAERVDDMTFQFRGEIGGVNTDSLEAVASMDRDSLFYFVSTRSYSQTASTLYRGNYSNGSLYEVELVPGVSTATPGIVDFDAEISSDGGILYFAEGEFGPTGIQTADILFAERNGDDFVRSSESQFIMQQINTDELEYAPAASTSGLEIFFTRLEGNTPAIFMATRESTSSQYGSPARITAITGFVEAPALSPDENSLYYHKDENSRFVIYRVTRS